ncbi:MAG: helix-turn-helix transcriptional regulator [Spirochaetes bacterium]|nr:helix-turn-helix transcriptional regulator [Spirochaetota bacterium]
MMKGFDISIDDAGYTTVDSRWSRHSFPYPHNRLYFITEGEASIRVKNGGIIKLVPGTMHLLPAFRLYSAACTGTMTHYWIHCSMHDPSGIDMLSLYDTPLSCTPADSEQVRRACKTIIAHHRSMKLDARLASSGAIHTLLAPFFTGAREKKGVRRFFPVLAHIDAHLAEELDIPSLAALMPLEPNYFSNEFTKTFGISPKRFIIRRRIEASTLLLSHTSKPVSAIARETGFSGDVHFSRTFRMHMRSTPGAYRKIYRRETPI